MKFPRVIFPLFLALPFLAPAQTCPVRDLTIPATFQTALAATDCTLAQAIPDFSGLTQRVVQYRFTLTKATAVKLTMTSVRFDPVVLVFDSAYALRAVRSALTTDGVQRMTVHLPAGTFIVAFTSLRAATGAFQIETAADDLRACPIADLALGETAAGSLASTGCRVLDLTPYSIDETFLARYRVVVAERGAVKFQYGSAEFTPSFRLLGPTGTTVATQVAGEGDAITLISLAAGTYTVWANTAGRGFGAFNLSTTFERLRTCRSFRLAPGETATGKIDESDCRFLDIVVPSRDDSPVQLFEFEMPRKGILTLDMKSAAFDTYVGLGNDDDEYFTDNDDFELETTNSRVFTSLQPGPYVIYAGAFAGEAGEFTVSAAVEDQRTCEILDIGTDQSVNGAANPAADCRVLDLVAPSEDNTFADFYRLTLTERRVMSLAMRSTEVDTYLILADADGRFLRVNDDGPDGTNSLMEFLMTPGTYHLVASTFNGDEIGTYAMVVRSRPPVACQISTLGLSATVNGALADGDCRIADTIPLTTSTALVDQYRLRVDAETAVTLDATSTEFPAAVFIVREDYSVVASASADASGALRLRATLPAGTYLVLVRSALTSAPVGAYTLRTSTGGDAAPGPVPSSISKSAAGAPHTRAARIEGDPERVLPNRGADPRARVRPPKSPPIR